MKFKKISDVVVASEVVEYGGEILPTGTIQLKKRTTCKDADGNIIAIKNHRTIIHPGDDYSTQPQEVKDVCAVEHTPKKISDRAAFVLARKEI